MSAGVLLSSVFDDEWARHGSRVAIREDEREITFDELLRMSMAICGSLERWVRQPGSRVALVVPNSAAFVASFAAVARLGGVVAPLNPQYRPQELKHYLADLEAGAVVVDTRLAPVVSAVASTLDPAPVVLAVAPDGGQTMVRPGTGAGRAISSAVSSPLLQQYTSGSTGAPKLVIRTHANLLAELETLRTIFEIDERDRFIGVTPFSHVNGLVRTMMTSMYAGACLYPLPEFRRRRILELITRERITFFGGVPHMFSILGETPQRGDVDLSSLRVVFSSSAPLSRADHQRFRAAYGVVIRQLYGSTETGTISFNRDPSAESDPRSVGTPLPGVRVEVVDDNGQSVAVGEEGEFAIQSPFATSEYVGDSAASSESFRDGFYFSGDVGTRDGAGRLTIVGRKKLYINRGGFKVNPYEVEDVIRAHGKVSDVMVFGAPGPMGDELVCCVAVASEPCTEEEIVAHCRERIADFKIPGRIEFRSGLPRSSTGKIIRHQA